MSSFTGKVVLVTGGASGIGFLMGKKALERGASHLEIWDIDEDQLIFSAKELTNKSYSVSTRLVDVSNPAEVTAAGEKLIKERGLPDILFNNAGIVVGKPFHKQQPQHISRTIGVNTLGLMYVANTLLPAMMDRNSGHIVNITSASGLIPNPGMTVYAASKWAAIGWSESLRLELERAHSSVKILNVMPGYINTGMFAGVRQPRFMPLLDPHKISEKIMRAVEQNKLQLKAPFVVKLSTLARGILPIRVYDFVAGRIFRVHESMDTFRGNGDG